MYRKFSVALALVTALSVTESVAQSGSRMPGVDCGMGNGMMGWGMGQNGQARGRFAVIDLNDDGQVSDEEAASAALDVFLAMDADDDGDLTKEEYMSVRMGFGRGWNPARQAEMQERKSGRFGDMDADKNGSVSRGEFLDAAKSHHASADADGDGSVTPWEHRHRNWY